MYVNQSIERNGQAVEKQQEIEFECHEVGIAWGEAIDKSVKAVHKVGRPESPKQPGTR
jgi:hypothetical protein